MSHGTTEGRERPASAHHARVKAVFAGERPDRYPICEQAFASSVASVILGRTAYTGSTDIHFYEGLSWLKGEEAHTEFVEQIYQDTVAIHRVFDFDIFFLPWRMAQRPTRQVDEHTLLYGDPEGEDWCVRRFDPGSRTFGCVETGARKTPEQIIDELRRAVADKPRQTAEIGVDPGLLQAVKEQGDERVVAGGSGMAIPMDPEWLEVTALEPGLVGDWLDVQLDPVLASIEAQSQAGIWLINGGGDFAFNSGPIYSPTFFREVMAPRWRKIFDRCRELGASYIMRSDGNLWPVADTLFGECRPHAYYEVDADAGMRFGELRQAFPELVLMGNVSCPMLINGTAQQVRDNAVACLEAAAPRFVGASANSILHGTPPANVHALYDAITTYPVGAPS